MQLPYIEMGRRWTERVDEAIKSSVWESLFVIPSTFVKGSSRHLDRQDWDAVWAGSNAFEIDIDGT